MCACKGTYRGIMKSVVLFLNLLALDYKLSLHVSTHSNQHVCLYFPYNIPPDVKKLSGNCLALNFKVMDVVFCFVCLFPGFSGIMFHIVWEVDASSCKMTHRWPRTLPSPTSCLKFSHIMSTLWYSGFNNRSYLYWNILIFRPQFLNRGNHEALACSLPGHLSMGLFFSLFFFPRMW